MKARILFTAVLMVLLCLGSIDATAQRPIRRGERQQTQTQQTRPAKPSKEQQYQKDMDKGGALFDEEKYAEAKTHFETMLPKYPKHEKDINRYIKMCDTFLAEQEEEYRNCILKGEAMMRNGEYERALTHYSNMQSAYPNHASEISAQITACEDAMRGLGYINGHEYVDLGLPSGLKWATCNVGATSPEEYGSYFAWGETTTKSSYTADNGKTYDKSMGDISGSSSYDAARANWGGSWRMPTKAEFEELLNNCNWEWTSQGEVSGYKVTSKKNGTSIFFPAAGVCYGTSLSFDGIGGYYWSSTPYGGDVFNAYYLDFGLGNRNTNCFSRYNGRSVRPVSD